MRARTWPAFKSILVLLACALWSAPAHALHEESQSATRITSGDTHTHPFGRSWGNWFTFSSTQDLTNLGASRVAGRQIYVFNMAYYDCAQGTTKPTTPCPPAGTPFLRQVTNGPGDPDNPSLGNQLPLQPEQTQQDQWIAFDAAGVFNGNTGPAAARRQIFMKNLTTSEIRQVTASTTGDSTRPTVNEHAGVIAFESTANPLAGFPNPTGVKQVYLFQRGTGALKRISVGPAPGSVNGLGPAEHPVVNQTGTGIAFDSTSDLMGDGHDTGLAQIYYVTLDKRDSVTKIFRVTNGNGASRDPYLGDGPATGSPNVLVFDSLATDLPGASGPAGRAIYEVTIDPSTEEPSPIVSRLTSFSIFGDCFAPHIDPTGNRLGFICLGDPLQNSTVGNRLFVLDRPSIRLYQMTGAGDLQPDFGMNVGQWFVSIGTSSDLTGAGVCGFQLYILDYFTGRWAAATALGQLPPDVIGQGPNSVIGLRSFEFRPGTDPSGSEVAITTRDGIVSAAITEPGRIGMRIGAPDEFTQEAPILVEAIKAKFPPLEVPGFGAFCLVTDGDGQGTIDCDGGNAGLDITATRDHHINDTDPFCVTGCHEGDTCQEHFVPEPHLTECPLCNAVTATCDIGYYVNERCDPWPVPFCQELASCINGVCPDGTACNPPAVGIPPCNMPALCDDGLCPDGTSCADPDTVCQAGLTCVEDNERVCNGPDVTSQAGPYTAGGVRLTMPVRVTISQNPGLDDMYCTADDQFGVVQNLAAVLRLTTGTATHTVADADDIDGASISAVETGAPFDCGFVRLGDLAGARMMGTLAFLDIPTLPGLRDLIVSLRLEAEPGIVSSCSPTCTTSTDCDDGNVCNGTEACVSSHCTLGTPIVCDNGDACDGFEICDPLLGCQAGTPPNCDDLNVCTDDSCVPATGCAHAANANTCDDGLACTSGDNCAAGACVGAPVVCTDGDACNGLETCDPGSGLCLTGTPPVCDDLNPCTDDGCDPLSGCTQTPNTNPCDDANLCTDTDACAGGVCAGTLTTFAVLCNAGNGTVCDGLEACNPVTGACDPGTALNCDDVNPCTDDSCDPVVGCQHVNNANPCSDASACTLGDVCTGGACVGTPLVCDNGDACDGLETCDPASGCVLGTPPDCDDLNACTDDSCDPLLACQHVNNTNPCTDGSACTAGDVCAGGVCTGAAVVCDDGDACNGVETCDPGTGCLVPPPLICDDDNECTDDTCIPITGCVFTNNANPCSDGDECTTTDACSGGACAGTPVVCTDGDACNGVETCNATTGLCDPGTSLDCDDLNVCTDDSCVPATGCVNVLNTNPCSDGSACTTGDVCTAGSCVGTTVVCSDGNACNGVETCDPAFGCQIGTTPNCDDSDTCTADTCDAILGCVNAAFPNLAVCRIITLIDAVAAMSDEELGGQKKRLLRKASGALKSTQRFYTGNPRLARTNLRRAERRLLAFVHIVQTGLIKGTIVPTSGDLLLDLAADAATALAQAVP